MYFQVHTRHIACSDQSGTCNCAVAVREGNDILGINACNGRITPIRYMRDPNTPDGNKANITRRGTSYRVGSFLFEFNDFGFSLLCYMGAAMEFGGAS